MAKGKKKEFVARTFKLNPIVVDKLDKYSEETGISRTFIVERAVDAYLTEKLGKEDKE